MKKLFGILLAVCLLAGAAVPAYAVSASLAPGETLKLDIGDFENFQGAPPPYTLYKSNYDVGYNFTSKCAKYISRVYIDDTLNQVVVEFKDNYGLYNDVEIVGTISILDKERTEKKADTFGYNTRLDRYVCEIVGGDVTLLQIQRLDMEPYGTNSYGLPYDYQNYMVRFRDSSVSNPDKATYNFVGNFEGAVFEAKVMGQDSLFLGTTTAANSAVTSKYSGVSMRFLRWINTPVFNIPGKLTIKASSNEYVYQIKSDGSLQAFGSYDAAKGGYTATTDTLGAYVISSKALSGAGAAAPAAASSAPATNESTGGVSKNPNTGV